MELSRGEPSINPSGGIYLETNERSEKTPLQGTHSDDRGLRLIITFFTALSIGVTIALIIQIHYGDNKVWLGGGVVTDSGECSRIGGQILEDGGTAVDAAIAASFCTAVVLPHLTSLSGGGVILIYDQRERKAVCLDFRTEMTESSEVSGKPGFVAGLLAAHKAYGFVSWSQLLQPAIHLALNGYRVADSLVEVYSSVKNDERLNAELREWLAGQVNGDVATNPPLAAKLQRIASSPSDGSIHSSHGGGKRLSGAGDSSSVEKSKCISGIAGNFTTFSTGSGTGGPLLLSVLSSLFNTTDSMILPPILKTLKGNDELSLPYYSGTTVTVMDGKDVYVSVVSGLGSVLGSGQLSSEGYIINNAVQLAPNCTVGSKPASLLAPLVATHSSDVCAPRFLTGGGDARDVVEMALRVDGPGGVQAWVEAPRARLSPSSILLEKTHAPSFSKEELNILVASGHQLGDAPLPYPSIPAIYKVKDDITPYADSRGRGIPVTVPGFKF